MNNAELQAISIARKHVDRYTLKQQLKKFHEEVYELTEACLTSVDLSHIKEESGDVLFVLLHILTKLMDDDDISFNNFLLMASDKLEMRRNCD